jgi:ABC-type lipoprotein release transport system permease subunit
MTSMQEGSYAQMIKTIVNSYSGHIQIFKSGYWEDKIIGNSFEYTPEREAEISGTEHIATITPRLETFALASSSELTKGVMVMGIAPAGENEITGLSKKIIKGRYLADGDAGVIAGSDLARYLKLDINDTLVLLGQGYHGVSAAGKYPVRGIIKFPSPELNRGAIYMDINCCGDFLSAPGRATSVVIMADREKDVNSLKKVLYDKLGSSFEIKDWKEMNRVLLKQIDSDRASGTIIKGVLYFIIAFGIFGTVMMMTLERRKEFGVIIAVGMQKHRLCRLLYTETIMIGFIGSITGIAASIPIVWYYLYHPIRFTGQAAESMLQMGFEPVMSFSIAPAVFINQGLTILIFTLFIGLYPVLAIGRLKVNKALKS